MHIRSEHAVGYLKGQFQSLHGLHQQINSECDYKLVIAWIHACLIIHSFVAWIKDFKYKSDFWEWVDEGMSGEDWEREEDMPFEGFVWNGGGPPVPGETEGQRKCCHVQEALFHALY